MNIDHCPLCHGSMKVQKLKCLNCDISIEGEFFTSSILSLSEQEQIFVEHFILNSGSLKEMAKIMQVTYPTIRSRLDTIIKKMKQIAEDREGYKEAILEKVEEGKLSPENAANIIKNM